MKQVQSKHGKGQVNGLQIEELLDENATFHNIITDLYSEHLIDNSTIHIGDNGPEIDLMELLRISSMVYIGL